MFRSSEDEDTDTTISESETNVELAKSSLTDENVLVSDPEIKTGTIVRKDPLAEPISFAQISKTSEKSDSSDEESEHQDPQAQIESGLDLPDAANEECVLFITILSNSTSDITTLLSTFNLFYINLLFFFLIFFLPSSPSLQSAK